MFSMIFHNRIAFSNPFMFGYSPRANFYMGMALATSGLQTYMPMGYIPMCGTVPYPQTTSANASYLPVLSGSSNLSSYTPVLNNSTFKYDSNSATYSNLYSGTSSAGMSSVPFMTFQMPKLYMPNISVPVITPQGASSSSSNPEEISTKGRLLKGKGPGSGYGPEFLAKVKKVAQNIKCDYRDLLAIMNHESGINAHVKCRIPGQSASGLIQIVETSANAIGTTTAKLRAMSPIEQLDYVEKYFKMAKKTSGFADNQQLSAGDLYALGFGASIAKKDVLAVKGQKEYTLNAACDVNKDGKITKSDLASLVHSNYVNDNSFLA